MKAFLQLIEIIAWFIRGHGKHELEQKKKEIAKDPKRAAIAKFNPSKLREYDELQRKQADSGNDHNG